MGTLHHHGSCEVEQGYEVLNCISSCVFDVIKGLLGIHLVPLCYLADSLRTEGALCIDVDNFPISPAFFFG